LRCVSPNSVPSAAHGWFAGRAHETFEGIGQLLRRKEDVRPMTGTRRYDDDISLPDKIYLPLCDTRMRTPISVQLTPRQWGTCRAFSRSSPKPSLSASKPFACRHFPLAIERVRFESGESQSSLRTSSRIKIFVSDPATT
jgi:hypothetical protein